MANVLRVFGGGGLARLIGRTNVLVLLSPIALSTKIGFTICLTYKPGMESSRHLPRLEAASRQFFSWFGLASASHGLASVLARSGR